MIRIVKNIKYLRNSCFIITLVNRNGENVSELYWYFVSRPGFSGLWVILLHLDYTLWKNRIKFLFTTGSATLAVKILINVPESSESEFWQPTLRL